MCESGCSEILTIWDQFWVKNALIFLIFMISQNRIVFAKYWHLKRKSDKKSTIKFLKEENIYMNNSDNHESSTYYHLF